MVFSTGGSVANTGIGLIKLGMNTPLMAKVGDEYPWGLLASFSRKVAGLRNFGRLKRRELFLFGCAISSGQ